MARAVVASRRFQREYPQFLRKYTDLEVNFREFLRFRAEARPDQTFNAKDGRLSGTKFHRCHLIHGKAILVYQLQGSEIRLIALDGHNMVETGTNKIIRDYARSLTSEDYYRFNVDAPVPPKPSEPEPPAQSPIMTDQPIPDIADTIIETAETTTVHEPEPVPTSQWADKLVHFQHGTQLIYKPRPAHPLLVVQLTKELIAPAGDYLAIDLVHEAVHHLTPNELDARYERDAKPATTLGEAVTVALEPPKVVPIRPAPVEPKIEPKVEPRVEAEVEQARRTRRPSKGTPIRSTARRHNVGAQLGRLVVTCGWLQGNHSAYDSAMIAEHLSERDQRSLSAVLCNGQNAGLIKKAGRRDNGRGYLYCLTREGLRIGRVLGDWPFAAAGVNVPKFLQQPIAAE